MSGLYRPGDRFYAYCGTCQRRTSWVYLNARGDSCCTEH